MGDFAHMILNGHIQSEIEFGYHLVSVIIAWKIYFIVIIKGHIEKTEHFGLLKWDVPLIDMLIVVVPEAVASVRKLFKKFNGRKVVQGRIDSFFKVLEIRNIVNVIWS